MLRNKASLPLTKLVMDLIGVTNLYQTPQQTHERKVRTVGEKNLSQVSPERYAFALSGKYRNPLFSPP